MLVPDSVVAEIIPPADTVWRDTTRVDSFYIDHRTAFANYSNSFVTEPGIQVFGTNGINCIDAWYLL